MKVTEPRPWVGFTLAAFLAVSAFGQAGIGKGRLTGAVVDQDGKPVASVKIVLKFIKSPAGSVHNPEWRPESAVFETSSDKSGNWTYLGLAGGIWEVQASKDGYHSSSRQVQVQQLSSNPHVKLRLDSLTGGAYSVASGLLEKANEQVALGKYEEAVLLYRQYLETDPGSVMVMLSIGDALQEAGRLDEAAKEYQALADLTSANPGDKEITARALTGLGECAFRKGDGEGAAKHWKLAIETSPSSEVVAANLAQLLFSLGKGDEAAVYYLKALEIAPARTDLRLKLAYVYLHLNDFDKARAELAKIIETLPGSALAAQARKLLDELEKKKWARPLT